MSDLRVKKREEEDRLSQLPNVILGHILSYLSMQEAARTSVLSASWRHLWLLFVSDFEFEFVKPKDISLNVGALRDRFFNGVDRVLQSHRELVEALPLQKLRIQFRSDMEEHLHGKIDEWVSYAFAKRVRSLELDFLERPDTCYSFPIRIIAETETDMSFLRSLSLSGVSRSKQDIDYILLNCHSLESLKVSGIRNLESVEIGSSCPALKQVEILDMYRVLPRVVVRDSCLVSLKLDRVRDLVVENNPMLVSLTLFSVRKSVLENNPKLVSACVSFRYVLNEPTLRQLSSYLSRLHTFTMNLKYTHAEVFDEVPELSELKHLTLIVSPLIKETPFRLTSLLSLSPNLEKLGLELVRPKIEGKIEYEKGPKVALPHLKTIEVCGYHGEEAEDELIRYALEHVAAPIQTIIFDPRPARDNITGLIEQMSFQSRAELLKRVIPSSVKYIVL